MTARQLNEKGYYIKKGEHPTLCEKWIFDREKIVTKEDGTKEKIWESLEMPAVRYFNVFNGEQVQDFPEYIHQKMEVSDMLQAGLPGILRVPDYRMCPAGCFLFSGYGPDFFAIKGNV